MRSCSTYLTQVTGEGPAECAWLFQLGILMGHDQIGPKIFCSTWRTDAWCCAQIDSVNAPEGASRNGVRIVSSCSTPDSEWWLTNPLEFQVTAGRKTRLSSLCSTVEQTVAVLVLCGLGAAKPASFWRPSSVSPAKIIMPFMGFDSAGCYYSPRAPPSGWSYHKSGWTVVENVYFLGRESDITNDANIRLSGLFSLDAVTFPHLRHNDLSWWW